LAGGAQLPREEATTTVQRRAGLQEQETGEAAVVTSASVSLSQVRIAPPDPLRTTQAVQQGDAQSADAAAMPPRLQLEPRPIAPDSAVQLGSIGSSQIEFEGLDSASTDRIPPDTAIAVGPEHVVEAINRGFAIYTKLGNPVQAYTLLDDFFAAVLPSDYNETLFDPRTLYSQEHGQYFIQALGKDEETLVSFAVLAVSATSDPTGSWYLYRIDLPALHSDAWWDYASLAVDGEGIFLTGNLFEWADDDFKTARIVRLGLQALFGGTPTTIAWSFLKWPDNSLAFGLQVATPHTLNGNAETFFVNTRHRGGDSVLLWILDNPTGALANTEIASEDYLPIDQQVRQPGTALDIHGGDARVMNVLYSNRRLYATWTTDPVGDGDESGTFLLHLHTDDETNLWDDVRWTADAYNFHPAITIQGGSTNGPAMVFSSRTDPLNATGFASSYMQVFPNWGVNPSSLSLNIEAGSNWYYNVGTSGGTRNRWGDYSAATWDPACNMAWGASEYASSAASTTAWSTRISAHQWQDEPSCKLLDVTFPNGGENVQAGQTVTVEWDSFNLGSDGLIEVLLTQDGGFPTFLATGLPRTTTSYSWNVANYDSANAVISVGLRDGFDLLVSDSSNSEFTIAGKPDYSVSAFGVASAAAPGQQLPISITVLNSGPVVAPPANIQVRLSTNDICSLGDTQLDSFNSGSSWGPNQSLQFSRQVTVPAGTLGNVFLCLMPDPTNSVLEFDESNNFLPVPLLVSNDLLFTDGFETGDTTNWSATIPISR
jgi:hypothetical protein